jgi:hypothetical protein
MAHPASAQVFEQRGFAEVRGYFYPQTVPPDDTDLVVETLVRWEPTVRPRSWLRVAVGVDVRIDSHNQVERRWTVDWWDRGIKRPPISIRRLSVQANKGPFSVEAGKQFIRWGKADILNPTDRFAPRDYLNVVDNDFLAVTGVRGTFAGKENSIDVVWVPRLTPSRLPLFGQRWSFLPEDARRFADILDLGARYPEGSQIGTRWNHVGRGFELSLSFYNGFNHLPLLEKGPFDPMTGNGLIRTYPQLRMYGGDMAVPTRWFTIKGEVGYFTSNDLASDEYGVYVIQLERQAGEWQFVAGYSGDFVTRHGAAQQFSADRGLSRALLGRASYTIDTNQSLTFEAAVRRTGDGAWVKAQYSRAIGQHWRATVEGNLIRGDSTDFLGQYRRNSHVNVTLRYSF